MVLCFRCQMNIAEYECEICNGFYCAECDKFIHSKKPKNGHMRKQLTIPQKINTVKNIQNIPPEIEQKMKFNKTEINSNFSSNIPKYQYNENNENNNSNYNPKDIQYFSQTYQLENSNINNLNNKERIPLNYSQQIIEEKNINDEFSKNMNNCIETINNEMNEEYIYNPDEKDTEIKALLKKIEDQRELEKYKLIEDYENQMREISQNYLNKKTECIKGMQDIDDKMREIENAKEEEKRTMYDEIDRLKNEGNNIEKEQEYLMKSNDELNHKLKETSNNIDLLRTNTLGTTSKFKGKKKVKTK